MARKPRDYSAEYRRRNELAQQRGFKSYGQQRHYTEYTGTPVRYIVQIQPEEIQETYWTGGYDYADYEPGKDPMLDAWIRRSTAPGRDLDEEQAYLLYMRRSRGGKLSRTQIRRLSQQVFQLDWDSQWDSSAA